MPTRSDGLGWGHIIAWRHQTSECQLVPFEWPDNRRFTHKRGLTRTELQEQACQPKLRKTAFPTITCWTISSRKQQTPIYPQAGTHNNRLGRRCLPIEGLNKAISHHLVRATPQRKQATIDLLKSRAPHNNKFGRRGLTTEALKEAISDT